MNNQNSSKQVLLSIIGIAILVVAVVGVSFAFFNYSKVGEENNTVTTGTIFFNFTEGTGINLVNQFPMGLDAGKALKNDTTPNSVLAFSVVGHNTAASPIEYTIYALEGDAPEDETHTTKLSNYDVMLYLTGDEGATASTLTTNNISTPTTVGKLLEDQSGTSFTNTFDAATSLKLGVGQITGGSNENTTHKYELRMWISNDVQIHGENDTAPDAVNKAGVYSQDNFSKMYYSLKLHIEAATKAAQ